MRSILTTVLIVGTVLLNSAYICGQNLKNIRANKLVISFKNIPVIDNKFEFSKNVYVTSESEEMSFFGINFNEKYKFPKTKIPDPINLSFNDEYIVLRHKIDFMDYNDYLLKNGDSVEIKYLNKIPFISVINRETKKLDYTFEYMLRKQLNNKKYSILSKYFNASQINLERVFSNKIKFNQQIKLPLKSKQDLQVKQINLIRKELKNESKEYIDFGNHLLDSLNKINLISIEAYSFYKNKLRNLNLIIDIETENISFTEISKMLESHRLNIYGYPEIFRHQLIEAISDKYFTDKARTLDLKDAVNRDYKQIYTQIDSSNLFPEKDRNYLLIRELNRIAQTFSRADFMNYMKKFEQRINDTLLVNQMKLKYALDFDGERNTTKSLVLRSTDGKSFTLDEVNKRYAGKVIYADFWASWCAPCRASFPNSIKLREKLRNKNVVFFYLSIDQTLKPWENVSAKENLATHKENFLIVNSRTSDFMKQYKLNSIPRYMIFDKEGKLAYDNAPNPESKELEQILLDLSRK